MKAVRVHEFGPPSVKRLNEVADPTPAPNQVLVHLRAIGVNASLQELVQVHAALEAGMEARALRPIVGRELPLADAPKAHDLVMQPGAYGKIVLIP